MCEAVAKMILPFFFFFQFIMILFKAYEPSWNGL